MLKPMQQKRNNNVIWIVVAVLIFLGFIFLAISFRGSDDGLDEVNAAYTSAAETVSAQQLTNQAASTPTWTPVLFTPTIAFTLTPLATPTLLLQPALSSPTSSVLNTAVGCDNSVHVADVTIPDNTAMAPGQAFKKTWKLQNIGACPWTSTYKVTFLNGNQMSGVAEPITIDVPPGSSADVSVNMVVPATSGDALGYWILTNASGQQFGTNFFVLIKVTGSGPTATAGATATFIPNTPIP